jgi:hypothetical protein
MYESFPLALVRRIGAYSGTVAEQAAAAASKSTSRSTTFTRSGAGRSLRSLSPLLASTAQKDRCRRCVAKLANEVWSIYGAERS